MALSAFRSTTRRGCQQTGSSAATDANAVPSTPRSKRDPSPSGRGFHRRSTSMTDFSARYLSDSEYGSFHRRSSDIHGGRRSVCPSDSEDCSAGACERNWSSYSLIHTKIRNRLSTSQLEKLVYCRANMRLVRSYHALGSPKQVDPTLLKMVDDPTPEEVDRQIRDEQEEILRDLHRELESVDRRVTRSRARALSIPLRPAAPDPDTARRESIRRGKLPVRTQRRRANEAVRLLHTEVSDPDEEDAQEHVQSVTTAEPEFDEEGNVLDGGGMLSSDDSSSSSSDDEL